MNADINAQSSEALAVNRGVSKDYAGAYGTWMNKRNKNIAGVGNEKEDCIVNKNIVLSILRMRADICKVSKGSSF